MAEFRENTRQTMEDLFYRKEDQKLIEKLRAMKQMKDDKRSLSEVSGIHNDAVLEKLVKLGIKPETMACLAMTPLVEVAWADGKVDEKERAAILSAAEKEGIIEGSIEYALLKQLIATKPTPALLEAWRHFIQGLCEKLTEQEKSDLKAEIMAHAQAIAKASGGFLGLGSVSKSEQQMIGYLESAFETAQ